MAVTIESITEAGRENIQRAHLRYFLYGEEEERMKEVTIIHRDGSNVGLGILEQTGTKFYHVRYIKDAFQGGIELSDRVTEIPMEDVEIVDGYDYQALIDFQDRNRSVLLWRGARQAEVNAVREKAMSGVEAKVARDMKAWDKANPEPAHKFEGSITEVAEDRAEAAAIRSNASSNTPPDDEDPVCGCLEFAEKGHDPACKFYEKPEDETPTEGLGETADLCPSTFNRFPCELPNDHDGKHTVTVDEVPWEWDNDQADVVEDELAANEDGAESSPELAQEPIENFQAPADPPTPEDAQEPAQETPEEAAAKDWGARCHSLKGSVECSLPADHDEEHCGDPDSEDALKWTDEEQDGEMPF